MNINNLAPIDKERLQNKRQPHVEDARIFILKYLSKKIDFKNPFYAYEFSIRHIMSDYIIEQGWASNSNHCTDYIFITLGPFNEASWELCRMGILRPLPSHDDMNAEYTITSRGLEWLKSFTQGDNYIPTHTSRFIEELIPYSKIFGNGFLQRASEAIKAYNAQAYFACCAMAGAAAESLLLSLAINKKDEKTVLDTYNRPNGTTNVKKILFGDAQPNANVEKNFDIIFYLLNYWRNAAAHGQSDEITELQAYSSLVELLKITRVSKQYLEQIRQK